MISKLKIGWSEIDLTPDKKVRLAGQFFERISERVETRIYATAMAIESDGEQAVLCSADLVATSTNLLAEVRRLLADNAEGLDVSKIVLSATHTHTSIKYKRVSVTGKNSLDILKDYLPAEKQYVPKVDDQPDVMSDDEALAYLAAKLAAVILDAWKARDAAYYANEFGRAAVGLCRRSKFTDLSAAMWGDTNTATFDALEGGNDSGLELLYVFDKDKKLRGVVANLACPAQTVQHRSFISSDFWGKAKILIRKNFGSDIYLLALCSAAGDQCPIDLIRWVEPETPIDDPNIKKDTVLKRKADPSMFDIKGSWRQGKRIANEVIEYYEDAVNDLTDETPFKHESFTLEVPLRQVTKAEYDAARKELEEYIAKAGKKNFDFNDNAKMHVCAGIMARFETQETMHVSPCEIHIIRLGNIALATNPFELFLDYGNRIKARSYAQQTFLVQLACGSSGYLPTARAEEGSHYSAYVSSGVTGHVGGDLLVKKTLDIINNRLFAE